MRLIRKRQKLQFTSFMTTFYDKKGICQIFSLDNQLVVQASHDKLLKEAENEILLMEQFFASLVRINRNIRPQKETEALLNRPYHLTCPFVWEGASETTILDEIACNKCNHLFPMKDRAWEKITNEKNLFECPARHDKVLLENVTTFRIPEVSPCPCCLQQAKAEESEKLDLSPSRKLDTYGGTFNAGLYPLMDDSNPTQEAVTTCFHCVARGGLGQIKVFQFCPP